MKNKIFKILNGKRLELKGVELDEYKNSIIMCCVNKLEEIKNNKIDELTEKTKKIFYDKYPLHKQCNIAIYGTEEEREEFKKFHDIEVAKYDEQIDIINSYDNLEQLNSIKFDIID